MKIIGIPHFQYTFGSPSSLKNGYITLGEEKIHRINDVEEFYEALGYTKEIKKLGLGPEEFFWEEYRRDGSRKKQICFQVKIIEYLNKHSATYKEKYAVQFESWLANCMEKWSGNSAECKNCAVPQTKRPAV
jgi:hypothetical protein